ncbi:MAG: glutaminyl-peptide cyclotransferase [Nannocystaceae bacterium]
MPVLPTIPPRLGLCVCVAVVFLVLAKTAAGRAEAQDTLTPEIVEVFPHDSSAFTQGLILFEGDLYESTGQYGASAVRRVSLATGIVLDSTSLDAGYFGEGLARVDDRLIQLTWRAGVAFEYNLALELQREYTYEGEGWGLCFDGHRLVMSDGSASLFFRDPDTFERTGSVGVVWDGGPLGNINELECVDKLVYANIWLSDTLVAIDPATGQVEFEIDASGLLTPEEATGANVLNGIARIPGSGHVLITGKYWPKLFEVRFDDDDDDDSDDDNDSDDNDPLPPTSSDSGTVSDLDPGGTADPSAAPRVQSCACGRAPQGGGLAWLLIPISRIRRARVRRTPRDRGVPRLGTAALAPWATARTGPHVRAHTRPGSLRATS